MIHVLIDTSIYRQNPKRDSLNFRAIEKLADANWLKIHIPYIVEREFQTQQREIYSKDLSNAINGLNGLARKQLSLEYSETIQRITEELESKQELILDDAERQFTEWGKKINANRFPLCIEQTNEALESYFRGKPPFKNIKSRNDIPDGFIVQSVLKICNEVETQIHFVAHDKKLREAFNENDKIKTYQKLSDFVETSLVQQELKDLDFLDDLDEITKSLIAFENEHHEIHNAISSEIGEALIGKNIHDDSIYDDENSAIINGYYDAEDIEINFDDINYYGSGHIGMSFSLKILVSADFYIFKSDYHAMVDYDMKPRPSVTDHNDHYYEAEDEFELVVEGVVSLVIDPENIVLEDLSKSIEDVSIKIDEINNIKVC
ncbi:MAG: DUF4935 domain-containing protein [Deltaproteobacteria bacterium]|nr:DUF4935 domain-containing protein [Deltaproteobacteria bacterium]